MVLLALGMCYVLLLANRKADFGVQAPKPTQAPWPQPRQNVPGWLSLHMSYVDRLADSSASQVWPGCLMQLPHISRPENGLTGECHVRQPHQVQEAPGHSKCMSLQDEVRCSSNERSESSSIARGSREASRNKADTNMRKPCCAAHRCDDVWRHPDRGLERDHPGGAQPARAGLLRDLPQPLRAQVQHSGLRDSW